MKKKLALSLSATLVAALCVPAIAFAIGGAQPDEMELEKTAVQTTSAIEIEDESTPAQAGTVDEAKSDEQSAAIDATEPDVQPATPARGYNYVDNDGDGVCDNYVNGNCSGVGNGVCDGTGANGNGGYGNRGGNGQGAADRYCDGSGRGANQGGHHGNGHQSRSPLD